MRFPAAFLEDIRDRLPLSQVVGRRVKLRKAGREWAGLSPFNQEKTPSFFVNDAKARWFDHSAGKDGDVFAFVMETTGASFTEAVESLAREAGLPLPAVDVESTRREARKLSLIEVVEHAATFFRRALAAPNGEAATARAYLEARGIDSAAQDAFAIGYAPLRPVALAEHLEASGVDLSSAREAGLLRSADDDGGGDLRACRFRGRVLFPIRDQRGRTVGFGGRAIAAEAKPKYLNSPESSIFDKGSILFNGDRARRPAWDGATVIALEGYMDVVASTAAGFPASVCTMGTAITDRQLTALWRLSDEPVVCLDGDSAGQRAVAKLIALALPMLIPGRTLRFAMMPPGQDPDDVVRKRGAAAYRSMIEGALPMADALWRSVIAGKMIGTPDARAALAADIDALLNTINDPGIRKEYRRDLRDRLRSLPERPPVFRANGGTFHSASPSAQRLVHGIDLSGMTLKESITIAAMVVAPDEALRAIDKLAFEDRLSAEAREAITKIGNILSELDDGADVMEALAGAGMAPLFEAVYDKVHRAGIRSLDPGGDRAVAVHALTRH